MLPILKRYAQADKDFPEMRDSKAYELRELSASALRHWYELDPAGARPAIIKEISRPRPRFDARVLGMLPDATLPEVDFNLAENFAASDDLDGSSHLASLIARFASAAILPQIVEKLDPMIGKSACAIQNPILAYLLRVDPAIARPRIERAIAARGEKFTACRQSLFQNISEIHYDPVLEEIGIQSLDDADPQVAGTAATMLGKFGSPEVEAALWQRYTSWTAKWAGRESQLERMLADAIDDNVWQLNLGLNLARAIATGDSWIADKNKLQRLLQMTKVRRIQQDVESYLRNWQDEALTVSIDTVLPARFSGRVAQYEFQSMKALKDKLHQFPPGSKFLIWIPPQEPQGDQLLTELRAFFVSHSLLIAEPKNTP